MALSAALHLPEARSRLLPLTDSTRLAFLLQVLAKLHEAETLEKRIAALEATHGETQTHDEHVAALEGKRGTGNGEPPVVTMLPGEMPEEARARLTAAARTAPVLLVPSIPDVETSAKQSERYQDWLLRRTGDTKRAAPTVTEVEHAYRAAIRGEGMPL